MKEGFVRVFLRKLLRGGFGGNFDKAVPLWMCSVGRAILRMHQRGAFYGDLGCVFVLFLFLLVRQK